MNVNYLTFGPVDIKIITDNSFRYLAEYFDEWFRLHTERQLDAEDSDVTFFLSAQKDIPEGAFNFSDGRAWSVYLDINRNDKLSVYCTPKLIGHMKIIKFIPRFLIKPLLNDAPSFKYLQASYFLYNVMVPIMQMQLMKKNCTFIHSSSVSSSNGSYLFTGLGGVGKTTISSYLYINKENEFGCLGDDFSIISGDGEVFFNPMPMNVYPYNIKTFPKLKKYVNDSLSLFEKFLWKTRSYILGSKAAMKRIAIPEDKIKLFKDKINSIYYLERSDVNEIEINEIDVNDISFASKNILLDELSSKMHLFISANTRIGNKNILNIPTIDELSFEIENIYNFAFKQSNVYKISIPKNISAEYLGESIYEILQNQND